jgi:hypothetical protein
MHLRHQYVLVDIGMIRVLGVQGKALGMYLADKESPTDFNGGD